MKKFLFLGWLLMMAFILLDPVQVQGASKQNPNPIEVMEEGKAFELEDVARVLETHFQKMADGGHKRIEVKEVRVYERIVLPPGTYSYEIILPEQARRGGNISGTVLLTASGREVRRSRFSARVDIYADVVAARHPLKKYHEIEGKDVHLLSKNISLLPNDVVTELKDVLGKRTILSINPDEAIRAGMIEIPPVIKKGDRVILLVENQQFKITTLAEAKEEGRRGDRVRLINLSSKREVCGRVLDGNTVQIDF